jgi:osmotically-inducible protein OsmY
MTDAEITTALKAKLAAAERTALVTIDVETRDGTVYLRGTVGDEATRSRAAELARQTPGVREVVNELKVHGA